MLPFAYLLEKLTRANDENSNVRRESQVFSNSRLPSREGWPEIRRIKEHKKCTIM
uniref:G protein gamma domain-containing protein n=1 Tax=Heterorhabditis bacteriophora TaxID=37862 RepID=A0A1I7WPB2_HETBA